MTFALLQYYSDANEAESWMKEKEPLVTSDDYGRDEASAKVIYILVWSIILRVLKTCCLS